MRTAFKKIYRYVFKLIGKVPAMMTLPALFSSSRATVSSRWRAIHSLVPPSVLGGVQFIFSCHRQFSLARNSPSRATVSSRSRTIALFNITLKYLKHIQRSVNNERQSDSAEQRPHHHNFRSVFRITAVLLGNDGTVYRCRHCCRNQYRLCNDTFDVKEKQHRQCH